MSGPRRKSPEEIPAPAPRGKSKGRKIQPTKTNSTPTPRAIASGGQRKRNEGSLAPDASEAMLSAICAAARDGILVVDVESRKFVYTNSAMCRMLGYTAKELLELTLADIHPRELASFVDAQFAALVAGEIDAVEGLPTRRRDGSIFCSNISGSLVTIHGRNCVIGIFRNATAQRRADMLLREQDARLRRAESMVRLGHYAYNGDGGNFACSDGLKEIWGFDRSADITFADLVARIHPEDHGRVRAEFAKFVEARSSFLLEYRIVHPDGKQVTVQSKGEVAVDAPGGSPRWFGTMMDITERKRGEQALRESEERLRLVIDATHDGIWDWNVVTHEDYLSPRWKEILGYDAEDLPNFDASFFDRIHPDDQPAVAEAVRQHFTANAPFNVELRLRHKDGSYRWILSRGKAIFDSLRQPIRMIGSITDITGRKLAERTIAGERDRLRQILDAQFGFVAVLSLDSAIVEVNQAPLTLMGFQRAGVLGRRFCDIGWFEPDAESQVEEAIRRAGRGETVRFDVVARFPGVGPRDVDTIVSPLKGTQGEVINVVAFGVDITDRKQAERLVIENEARLKEAQQIAQTGSWDLDLVENRMRWSGEVFRILEFDNQGLGPSYEAFLKLVHPEDRDTVDTAYRQSLLTREPFEVTHRLLMPDGRIKYLLERVRSEFARDGRPIRSMGTVQDVTEKKKAEDRIQAQLQEKEVLLREIHHRVKNNLQIVSGLLLLQSASSKDPEVVRLFEESRQRVQAMASVHDILYQSSNLARVPMAAYIEKLISALRSSHGQLGRSVEIVTRISVGPVDLQLAIACGLIVNELVTNSLKHAFEGRDRGMILIELRETGSGHLRLFVQDDGRGMPADPSRAASGFGLRLTRLLAEQIGGKLEISSGPGTEVAISFPATP